MVTDVFVKGAVQGWNIAVTSTIPNVLMAFVIIKYTTRPSRVLRRASTLRVMRISTSSATLAILKLAMVGITSTLIRMVGLLVSKPGG
jgi:spore maturation protein SpmB